MIYKLLATTEWDRARPQGGFTGSTVDHRDGFIHLSAADQLVGTARRHFAGASGLTLLTVDPSRLGAALRWEPSRGGALFPHLYAPLPVTAVVAVDRLPGDVPVHEAVAAVLARTGADGTATDATAGAAAGCGGRCAPVTDGPGRSAG